MRTILHLEDDVDVLEYVQNLLESSLPDVQIKSMETPQDAEAFLLTNKVDGILCDIKMPETDGMTFLRNLRLTNTVPHPFVFYSGYLHEWKDKIGALKDEGTVDGFIAKPNSNELINFFKDWFEPGEQPLS